MLMLKEKVIDRTLRGWAISVVHVAGAKKRRQAETAAHLDEWVNSPGLQPLPQSARNHLSSPSFVTGALRFTN